MGINELGTRQPQQPNESIEVLKDHNYHLSYSYLLNFAVLEEYDEWRHKGCRRKENYVDYIDTQTEGAYRVVYVGINAACGRDCLCHKLEAVYKLLEVYHFFPQV